MMSPARIHEGVELPAAADRELALLALRPLSAAFAFERTVDRRWIQSERERDECEFRQQKVR